MIKITEELMRKVCDEAKTSPRKRMNFNLHANYEEPIQRFLNALEPETYIRPHKHIGQGRVEVVIILKGRVMVVEFTEDGVVLDFVLLDSDGPDKGAEIPLDVWHSFIVLEKDSVLYEFKEGPYTPDKDKTFADWAPEEGTEAAGRFNEAVRKRLVS